MSDPFLSLQRQIQALQDQIERLRKADAVLYTTGTFVPGYEGSSTAGSWTYSVQTGFYTRVGDRCFFSLNIQAATRPGAPVGNAWIIGLPFTSSSTANSHSAVAIDTVDAVTLSGTNTMLTARVPTSATRVELIEVTGTAPTAASFLNSTGISATAFFRVAGHYIIA